jgi:hypothetical protein
MLEERSYYLFSYVLRHRWRPHCPSTAHVKIRVLPTGRVVKQHGDKVEVSLGNGETGIFLRSDWEKLATKQWRMEDAYVHVPWRSVPEALPLVCRLWMYLWGQRSMQPNEDVVVRQSMLGQWGFTESPETIRKAIHRMETAGLVTVVRQGKKQLRVMLMEPRPPSKQSQKATRNSDAVAILRNASDGDIQL